MKKPDQKNTRLEGFVPDNYRRKSELLNEALRFFEGDLGAYIRAARGWYHWSQAELAKRADVSPATIRRMEAVKFGKFRGDRNCLERVVHTLELCGVMFIDPDLKRSLEGGVLFSSSIGVDYSVG